MVHQRDEKVKPAVGIVDAVAPLLLPPAEWRGSPCVFCGLPDPFLVATPSRPPHLRVPVRAVQVRKPMVGVALVGRGPGQALKDLKQATRPQQPFLLPPKEGRVERVV